MHRNYPLQTIFWGLTFLSLLLTSQVFSQPTAVQWIGNHADWQPQDYFDSRGLTAVHFRKGRLVLGARLHTGHVNYGQGEILLDTKFFPALDCQSPLDLRGREIAVEIEVPAAFAGTLSRPSRLYLFVKDDRYAASYSAATNVSFGGKFLLTLKPDALLQGAADPSRIRILGIKVELGAVTSDQFKGLLYVNSVNVNPPVQASTPPALPLSTPQPVLQPGDKIEVKEGLFYRNDQPWFLVGANWRITEYGQNFGRTAWFPFGNGATKHSNFVRINLEYARRAGIKLLRVGLLDDGRVMFDRDGHVVGYDQSFRKDIRTLLHLAQQAGIRIEFVLCDFLLAGKAEEVDGVWLRGRSKVIADPTLRAEFRAKFLLPFLQDWGTHVALFGFDLLSEPEWIVSQAEGGGWEDYSDVNTKAGEPIPRASLEAFINECAADIRQLAPGKLITVGVSARFIGLVNQLPSLTYLAPHHYHWMGELPSSLPSFLERAWMLEEFPTKFSAQAVPGSLSEYLNLVRALRGSGALFWNLTPGVDDETCLCQERPAKLVEVRNWVDSHATDIYP